MNNKRILTVLAIWGLLFGVANAQPKTVNACAVGTPTVSTDKEDYGPLETVMILGDGFVCGEILSVLVTAPDGSTLSGNGTGVAGPDYVMADGSGSFLLGYQLSGTLPNGGAYSGLRGVYVVTAANAAGTVVASTAFTDGGGGWHTCALMSNGDAKCWGSNLFGQIGDGTTTGHSTAVNVNGLSNVAQISAGEQHTCAMTASGGAKCWGYNLFYGHLGDGTTVNRTTPVDVVGLTSGASQISAGRYHNCALTTSGGVKCWGYNGFGQLGDGTFLNRTTPVDVVGLTSGVVQISAGWYHNCALLASGGVKCWGLNSSGRLGDGTAINRSTPVYVTGFTSGAAQIRAGGSHTCAVTTSGGAKCWGSNSFGQIGDGTTTTRLTAVDVSGMTSGVAQISTSYLHTCALTIGGAAKCWGANAARQLGDGTTTARYSPVDVVGLSGGISQISTAQFFTCALTTGGGVKCWGANDSGQLGDGTTTNRATPVNALGLSSGVVELPDFVGVSNQAPTASAGTAYSGNEGAAVTLSGASASDPNDDGLSFAWSVNSVLCSFSNPAVLNPSLTCSDNGGYVVTLAVSDGVNPPVSADAAVTINNVAPTGTFGNNGPINEGSPINLTLSSPSDPSTVDTATGFQFAFDCGNGYSAPSAVSAAACTTSDNGVRSVRGKVMDKDGGFTEYNASVTTNNVAPLLDAIQVDQALIPVNTVVNAGANFTDPGTQDTHSATWSWGDATNTSGDISESGGSGAASGSHSYNAPGVYTIRLTVIDKDGAISNESTYQYVVVYDPNGGYVTGGGWFNSPAGAYAAQPSLTGKANFGFVSKYLPGQSVPSGNTEFQFKTGNLNFKSTSYQWLVVAGARAQFKGEGTINGAGRFGFMLTAIDGQVSGGGGTDKFRIKIWDINNADIVIYDNLIGGADDANPTTALGGGSIVIHR